MNALWDLFFRNILQVPTSAVVSASFLHIIQDNIFDFYISIKGLGLIYLKKVPSMLSYITDTVITIQASGLSCKIKASVGLPWETRFLLGIYFQIL